MVDIPPACKVRHDFSIDFEDNDMVPCRRCGKMFKMVRLEHVGNRLYLPVSATSKTPDEKKPDDGFIVWFVVGSVILAWVFSILGGLIAAFDH